MSAAAGRCNDGEAAFAASLNEDFPGRVAREFHVAARLAVDAVQDVHASGRGDLGIAGGNPLPQRAEAVVAEQIPVGGKHASGDGAAFELEHFQAAGHGTAHQAEPVVGAVAEPCADLADGGALRLVAASSPPVFATSPMPGRQASGIGERCRGVEQ